LADRLEIHDVLMKYSRGVDRGYPELLGSVYHEGAVDRHGSREFRDARTEFPAAVVPTMDPWGGISQHHVTNWLIELDGDTARVESYFLGFLPTTVDDGSDVLTVAGGRYLDRFERRDGGWAISERSVVVDWSRLLAGGAWSAENEFLRPGRREADPSHGLFKRIDDLHLSTTA
jgi:hypothetical protein